MPIKTYTKGGITYQKNTYTGKVTRVDKPQRIEVAVGKTSSGKSVAIPITKKNFRVISMAVNQNKKLDASKFFTDPVSQRQSIDPNKLKQKTIIVTSRDKQGNITGIKDTRTKQSIGFSNSIKSNAVLKIEASRQPKILKPKVIGSGKIKPVSFNKSLIKEKVNISSVKSINNVNLQANLPTVTPQVVSKVIIPKNIDFGVSVVIPPNYLKAANYKGLGKFGRNLAVRGFAVPSDIVFGFQAGLKEWKSAVTGFVAGAGIRSLGSLKGRGLKSKFKLLGRAASRAAGVVAIPVLLYDAGNQYRVLKAQGNSDAFALSKVITTLGGTVGGAAAGASSAKVVTSKATRTAIAAAAKKNLGNIKKPTTQTYKTILSFLESANPVRPYKELVLTPSSLKGGRVVKRIDPITKQEIRSIINKLESIVKFGNQHISVIKKAPSVSKSVSVGARFKVKPLPVDKSLVPYVNIPQSTKIIANRYLKAYNRMLRLNTINRKKLTKSQLNTFEKDLRSLMKSNAQARKLKKGLQLKATRGGITKKGDEYVLKNLVTGKDMTFKSRKQWLKAVKNQIKLVNPSPSKTVKWLNIMNKKSVKPIYPKLASSNVKKEKFARSLLRLAAQEKKLKAGLQLKARRSNIKTGKGYYFRSLVTGKIRYFSKRKDWLKAVKLQQKIVNQGNAKVNNKVIKDFFAAANKEITSKDGTKLKFNVDKVKKTADLKKRIFTLQDINKKTSVKKTGSGGVEVKAANGHVVILETPKTITKNKAAIKVIQKQAVKTKQVTALKVNNQRVAIVKPQVLSAVKSYGMTISQASRIGSAIASALTKSTVQRFVQTPIQKKIIEPIFKQASVSKLAQDSFIIQKQKAVQLKSLAQAKSLKTSSSLVQKAKTVYGTRTYNKLKTIKDFSRKRKKTKFTKEEVKYMLSKVYVKGKYRPSLAALVYNITSFKAPTRLTGFEIRPIIKK